MGKTQDAGFIGQTSVLNRLVQLEYEVLIPWADYLGYDLAYLVDNEETHFGFCKFRTVEVVRVQCKVAWLSKDGSYITFNTHKLTNRLTKKVSYHGKLKGLESIHHIQKRYIWWLSLSQEEDRR
jgi:hypothetical protein